MALSMLDALLRLPASERVEIALALWESLSDTDREAEVALTDEQKAELDRRWAEYVANPGAAVPWETARQRLRNRP